MESSKTHKYRVVITKSAEVGFYEILEYVYHKYSLNRAEEVVSDLRDLIEQLCHNPERGAYEPKLIRRKNEYRYILYRRTSRAEIKIIYFINYKSMEVFVTDFFPTEKNPDDIVHRNFE